MRLWDGLIDHDELRYLPCQDSAPEPVPLEPQPGTTFDRQDDRKQDWRDGTAENAAL